MQLVETERAKAIGGTVTTETLPTLSWLDFSAWDRDRALDIMAQLREKETRDELGLGTIRDAFADRLFPGTSTLQTRARYFLFVPWIYQKLEDRRTDSASFAAKARKQELLLSEKLLDSGETIGVIGRVAGRDLKRLPSSIYWLGLATWGIRLRPGDQSTHHRTLDRWYQALEQQRRMLAGDEAEQRIASNWDPALPSAPEGFPEGATLDLTGEEAHYLRDKIAARHPDSLLFRMIEQEEDVLDTEWPWEWRGLSSVPRPMRELVTHAGNFAIVMAGAVELYNLMLAELRSPKDADAYRDGLSDWIARLRDERSALAKWDLAAFRGLLDEFGVGAFKPTRRFVEDWLRIALGADVDKRVNDAETRELVKRRELQLKGGLARLRGGRALELWGGASGRGMLNYRWHRVRQIVTDIREGLVREDGHAR